MENLFKPTSYHSGATIAATATLIWKGISFVNALLFAAFFGATYQTDIYFYTMMLLGFALTFMQRLGYEVLIPEAMFLQQRSAPQARHFLTAWLYVYIAVGILVLLLAGWPVSFGELFSRFSTQELTSQRWIIQLGFVWFALQLVAYYLQAVLEMRKLFTVTWLSILNAACPLVCLIVWGKQWGIASMLYGLIFSNALQVIVFLWVWKKQLGLSLYPQWYGLSKRGLHNLSAGQTLAVCDMMTSLLPIYLMSGLGVGIVSALNYCRQLTDSATEVFISRTANVAKIELTEYAAQDQWEKANHTFILNNYVSALILGPIIVFSCYFAPEIVTLFFKRGEFSQQAVDHTVRFLRPMLGVLLFTAPGYLQWGMVVACRKIREVFIYSAGIVVFSLALLWYGLTQWGAFSYPYLLLICQGAGFAIKWPFFKRYIPRISYFKQFSAVFYAVFWAGLALPPVILVNRVVPLNLWLQLGVCGSIYVTIYAVLIWQRPTARQFIRAWFEGFR